MRRRPGAPEALADARVLTLPSRRVRTTSTTRRVELDHKARGGEDLLVLADHSESWQDVVVSSRRALLLEDAEGGAARSSSPAFRDRPTGGQGCLASGEAAGRRAGAAPRAAASDRAREGRELLLDLGPPALGAGEPLGALADAPEHLEPAAAGRATVLVQRH